jgi:hypothetical protein
VLLLWFLLLLLLLLVLLLLLHFHCRVREDVGGAVIIYVAAACPTPDHDKRARLVVCIWLRGCSAAGQQGQRLRKVRQLLLLCSTALQRDEVSLHAAATSLSHAAASTAAHIRLQARLAGNLSRLLLQCSLLLLLLLLLLPSCCSGRLCFCESLCSAGCCTVVPAGCKCSCTAICWQAVDGDGGVAQLPLSQHQVVRKDAHVLQLHLTPVRQ